MASVLAWIPDLLFGSNVVSQLSAAGHDVRLASALEQQPGSPVDVLVVDLTADAAERIQQAGRAELGQSHTIGVYAHVEKDVRTMAEEAGFDLVVPRSRFAREGAALVTRISG